MPDARRFTRLRCGRIYVRGDKGADETIARLASQQHGVVARSQLIELGVTEWQIAHRLSVGRLRRLHAGVYAVGHEALTAEGRVLAAVLALPPDAAVSHRSAAALYGLVERPSRPVHVTATEHRPPRFGIVIHRSVLPPEEITFVAEVPATTVARTLLDLSAATPYAALRRLVKRAEFEHLIEIAELGAILDRYPRRRGRRALARILAGATPALRPTRSELEDRFFAFCAERLLPPPETNVELEVGQRTLEVDCLWRRQRLIVELDGYRAHGGAIAFQDDRARDRALVAAGWSPVRVTWEQLENEPDALEADLRGALAAPTPDIRRNTGA